MATAPSHRLILCLAVLAAGFTALFSFARAQEKLLTPDEIKRLDRENTFWRALRTEEDAETNLARLRRRGAHEDELAWFAPKLEELWDVDPQREWGWLRAEQVEAIKEVDRTYCARVRAARLRVATGIELDPEHRSESPLLATSRWQRAVFRALDYDQLAEFRLMNSASAQRAARHFEQVPLTEDERRTIYEWQRDYDAASGAGVWRAQHLDALLDFRVRLRSLLGDERFAVHLASADPGFAKMHDALGEEVAPTLALDAWWIRQRFYAAQRAGAGPGRSPRELTQQAAAELKKLLGETLQARYLETDDARWLILVRPFTRPPRKS